MEFLKFRILLYWNFEPCIHTRQYTIEGFHRPTSEVTYPRSLALWCGKEKFRRVFFLSNMFITCDLDHKNRNGGSDFNREKRELVALHLLSFGCLVTVNVL